MNRFSSVVFLAGCALAVNPYQPAPYHPAPAAYAPAPYQPAPYHPAAAAYAPAPAPYHPAPKAYAPAPAPYHPAPHHAKAAPYHEEPVKDYQFGYEVAGYDEYGLPNHHARQEQRDGNTVKGQYTVELPDCRTQIVDYYVDEYKQYHADVKYTGEICPDKSLLKHDKAYHAPAPAYKAAPAPYHAPAYKAAPAPYHAPAPAYAPAPYHAPAPAYAPAPYQAPAYAPAPYHT